jgi:tetratricopeptide (TPR) repeat protein
MADAYYDRWDLRSHGDNYRVFPDDSVRRVDRTPNEKVAIDSLRSIAFGYNPFMKGALDIPPQITNLKEWQANRDPRTAGFWAYARGDYQKAVKKWGDAIAKDSRNAMFHFPRAYAWEHLHESDSAVADLTALIDRLERIQDSTIAPYLSKDLLYYEIGLLRVGQKKYPEARAAYEHTLLENLGFYMAHVRLSGVALLLQDTATALNELETATLIRSDDPMVLTFRGSILDDAHALDEAEKQLRNAVHADTDYALPYALLGHVAEQRHDTTAALGHYREYLARASRSAVERHWVEMGIERLGSKSPPN